MFEYRVVWEMDISADNPEEAARKALAVHRNPCGIATVFTVKGDMGTIEIDLNPEEM